MACLRDIQYLHYDQFIFYYRDVFPAATDYVLMNFSLLLRLTIRSSAILLKYAVISKP